jgi:hypothetical protein
MSSTVYLTGMYLTISLVFVCESLVCGVWLFVTSVPVGKLNCSLRIDRISEMCGYLTGFLVRSFYRFVFLLLVRYQFNF